MSKSVQILAVVPLRDIVVFPHMVISLFVGRESSIRAVEQAMLEQQELFVAAQVESAETEPKPEGIHKTGTIVTIMQLLRMPDGMIKVLVEGKRRARTKQYTVKDGYFEAKVNELEVVAISDEKKASALTNTLLNEFRDYTAFESLQSTEVYRSLSVIADADRLADTIAAQIQLSLEQKQLLLEITDTEERCEKLLVFLQEAKDRLRIEDQIRGEVKKRMNRSHREYYLHEQLKVIKKELGMLDFADDEDEQVKLSKKIETLGMSKEAKEKALSELKRIQNMPPTSSEVTVSKNYLDWLMKLPWKKKQKINTNLAKAIDVLDENHFALDEIKERIVEYLAVQARVKKLSGPILCLVGPPGVGKTSLAQSIAAATGRRYARVSLGGVRDEAEIRGHRRTYVGALPGKVIQKIAKAGSNNPLFLLDEIDKMASDFRGDPASALLEVLDPEQNKQFGDHYLEVDYDLSDVMFVCTSNSMNIPAPLLDRMEVIRLSGYTESEKTNIVKQHLIPKQMKTHGLSQDDIHISGGTVQSIIRYYTREAGVRGLERAIAKICRKVVTQIMKSKSKPGKILVTRRNVEKYLGVKRFRFGQIDAENRIGQVTGLAWTEVGGDLLSIEAAVVHGKGGISSTGKLGEVMQESCKAALTVVRERANILGIDEDFYSKNDIHIHVPEGATPKDGPSAGIAICTALVSALTENPVKSNVAMTGEITLRGEVLPIGGLKEKLLAAHRGGITDVIIPVENEKDLSEIPEAVLKNIHVHPVRWIDQVLELALTGAENK